MNNCTCAKCTSMDNRDKERAFNEYQQGRFDVNYQSWEYECGDGCCYESGVSVYINDYCVSNYDDDISSVLKFFGCPNENWSGD